MNVDSLLAVASTCAALLLLLPCGYLGLLTLLSAFPRRPPPESGTSPRFAFVVPAHNEAQGIAATVASLRQSRYPADRFTVVVVADNCSDDTAARAAAAGATVLVRHDDTLRGKGYALEHAFAHLLGGADPVDAVVVVDADSALDDGALLALSRRLSDGALACQLYYAVRNPDAGWRTRLMAVAFAMIHRVRSRGRERLGVSCGLRGNGMCFTRAALERVPHKAYGLVEDVEYGVALARAGIRVVYVDEASVRGDMVASAQASVSQRQRWEAGRAQLTRQLVPQLLREAIAHKDLVRLDIAADLATPPLSRLVGLTGIGLVLDVALGAWRGAPGVGTALWAVSTACLGAYVLAGVVGSGLGLRAVSAMLYAPFYMVWKLSVGRRKAPKAWVRTEREGEAPSSTDAPR